MASSSWTRWNGNWRTTRVCAIIDNDVVSEAFGDKGTPAGKAFRDRLANGLRLIVGGKLLEELDQNGTFRKWRLVMGQRGLVQTVSKKCVDIAARRLLDEGSCLSNDHHVIALARLGGADLLFSNDRKLHRDFKNLVGGVVYTTRSSGGSLNTTHKRLLARRNLCVSGSVSS